MSIVELRKVTIYGVAQQRDEVLHQLQEIGCLHLIDISQTSDRNAPDHAYRNEVHEAIKYLLAVPTPNPKQYSRYPKEMDCQRAARLILENKRQREELQDERDSLTRCIEQTRPWGDFQIPAQQLPHGLKLWFYALPHRKLNALQELSLIWQKVNEDQRNHYVVVISADEPVGMPVKPLELDPRPLSVLEARLEVVDEQLESLNWQRVTLDRWRSLLSRDLDAADDEVSRMQALTRLVADQHVFAIRGWIPLFSLDVIESFCRENRLALEVERPNSTETPPTLLKNPTAVAGAEDAVTFYMTPAYDSWDPTWVMYLSFTFFFAMIMSDAGYGALMGLVLVAFWKKFGSDVKGRRLRNLLLALVVATIVYGIAIGSYFGVCPAALKPFQLKINGQPLMEQRDAMMVVSLAIGVAHLTLSNLIYAWRMRGSPLALGSVGWAGVLLGGLVYGIASSGSNSWMTWLAEQMSISTEAIHKAASTIGWYAVLAGLGTVFLFASTRPLTSLRIGDWVMRALDGLLALTQVSKIFGDVLSYLRLFALGLASAQLAVTFNGLASGALEVPGLGIFLAILILVAGHGINLLLGIISGVVHGLRLNCIEFFNWSLTEEGYPFRAFSKKSG